MNWRARQRQTVISVSMAAALLLSGCGEGSDPASPVTTQVTPAGSPPPPPPPPSKPVSTQVETDQEAQRFLARATYGANIETIKALSGSDAADWIERELGKPATLYLPPLLEAQGRGEELKGYAASPLLWDAMITADDQLRQRMVFALSQTLVISDRNMYGKSPQVAYYLDILSKNAFGNYRDILQEVTYSKAMAEFLTYYRNRKGDPKSGRMPDENYARELLQLFTIGLVELNMDGTSKLENGKEVETFTNEDITGLARTFTGLASKGEFYHEAPDALWSPLVAYADHHSPEEKTFLGVTVPAGTPPDESITRALDTIFEHPNVAPFVSRQLIQRFTASAPPPDYVERVATAFENGRFAAPNGQQFGTGQRGDLAATVAAILLDPSLYNDEAGQDIVDGKIREPVLKLVHWARAFDVSEIDSSRQYELDDSSSSAEHLGQHPLRAPSVFNFYRPRYVEPGSQTGERNLTAPEFQIVNEGSSVGYMNMLMRFILDKTSDRGDAPSFVPDYRNEVALADNPAELVTHLDTLLTGGMMTEMTRAEITDVVSSIEVRDGSAETDRLRRVEVAIFLAVNSSAYAIQR